MKQLITLWLVAAVLGSGIAFASLDPSARAKFHFSDLCYEEFHQGAVVLDSSGIVGTIVAISKDRQYFTIKAVDKNGIETFASRKRSELYRPVISAKVAENNREWGKGLALVTAGSTVTAQDQDGKEITYSIRLIFENGKFITSGDNPATVSLERVQVNVFPCGSIGYCSWPGMD